MLEGGGKAASTCLALVATYSVWMGLIKVWEDSGVARGVAKLIKPVAKKLLKTEDEEALQSASMNLAVNLLGISGAGTPYGIACANRLDKTENAEYSSAMFFVLNATSMQLFPASIIAVRVALNSVDPTSILLPTLFSTILSSVLGILLVRLFIPKKEGGKSGANGFIPQKRTAEGVR